MTVKQWLVLIVILAVLGGFVVWGAFGLFGGGSPGATLSQPTMSRHVNKITAQPDQPTDNFTPTTPEIFCSVKLSNAPADTEVKAKWVYLGGEAEDMANQVLYESEGKFEGPRYLSFSLTYDTAWPRGDYEVVLYLNGKEQLRVPFTVQ
jgi:hypothetical protein